MLNTGGIGNPFSVAATLNPGCTNEYAYERNNTGDIPVSMPSFIKTFRNPGDVLQGLPGGAVTKFTIRKQVENDGKVMITFCNCVALLKIEFIVWEVIVIVSPTS